MSTRPSSFERALRNEADQLSMFGVDASPEEIDALRDPATGRLPPDAFRRLRAVAPEKRGPGRPLNSVNKRSEQLAKLVIQQFGDPVLGAANLYAMPLDQLCEVLLVADGTIAHRERLEELTETLAERVDTLVRSMTDRIDKEDIRNITKACEALEAVASKVQGRPGDVALKALNAQLTARRFVAEYVHSKKPVEANVSVKADGVLVFPGVPGGRTMEALDETTRAAADQIAKGLKSGALEPQHLLGMRLRDDGALEHVEDGEFTEFNPVVDEDDG